MPLDGLCALSHPKGSMPMTTTPDREHPNHSYVTEYAYNGLGNLCQKGDTGWERGEYLVRPSGTRPIHADGSRCSWMAPTDTSATTPVAPHPQSGVNELGSDVLDDFVDNADWPIDDPVTHPIVPIAKTASFSLWRPVGSWFEQTNLVDRLSYMTNDMGDTIAYSYDSQGNVINIYQWLSGLGSYLMSFEIDPATSQIQKAHLNPGHLDELYQRLIYDEDGRITSTLTSTDGRIWHRDNLIEYDDLEILKKTLGHYQVQGIDYRYNIHGHLSAINTSFDNSEYDPGMDHVEPSRQVGFLAMFSDNNFTDTAASTIE